MVSSFKYAVIRFFRSYFKPMDPKVAQLWHWRMKTLYLFCAFQLAGFAFYTHQTRKREDGAYNTDESYTDKMIRVLDLEKTKVITLGRGGIVDEYVADPDDLRKNYESKKQEIYNKYSV